MSEKQSLLNELVYYLRTNKVLRAKQVLSKKSLPSCLFTDWWCMDNFPLIIYSQFYLTSFGFSNRSQKVVNPYVAMKIFKAHLNWHGTIGLNFGVNNLFIGKNWFMSWNDTRLLGIKNGRGDDQPPESIRTVCDEELKKLVAENRESGIF